MVFEIYNTQTGRVEGRVEIEEKEAKIRNTLLRKEGEPQRYIKGGKNNEN